MIAVERNGQLSSDLLAEAVAWRRDLHQHPEIAFKEHRTSDFVARQLTQFGLQVHRGLGGTGVVGTLRRGTSRRTIGIRADMDALPIEEQSGARHASSARGIMHACGHDGHVAMALAAARACAGLSDLDGTVHFIFQPAEEGAGGATRMIAEGLFRTFPCDEIYALHNWPALPLGTCVARDGAMMAAIAEFDIEISGRGCHAAMPHQGSDALLAACHLVSSLQSIVSRSVDPLQSSVVSATQIHGGQAFNVIPARCAINGTTRWFDDAVGDRIETRMRALADAIAGGFDCETRISYDRRFPATINASAPAGLVRSVAASAAVNLSVLDVPPSMGGEDFAVMLKAVPGCYLWLGTGRSDSDYGLHSPRFDFNDDALPLGVALWVALVRASVSRA
jgi:hippurate hydrolase